MKPKLLIVTEVWTPLPLSITSYYVNCVKKAQEEGWDVVVIEPSQFGPNQDLDHEISATIDGFKPDYVLVGCNGRLSNSAIKHCKKNNIVFNSVYHTDFPGFWSMQGKGSFEKLNQVVGKYYQDHHLVFTHSPSAIESMVANSIGKKHDVWWLGIRSEDFGDPRTERIPRNKPLLISVGRVTKQKNLDVFCQLDHNKYDLMVVGTGDAVDRLKAQYPHVDFVGWKSGKELGNIYAQADCMVFTSLYDTMGTVNIEAPWTGTPTAAFPVQGPIDAVDEGVNGYCRENINEAIELCLQLDRKQVAEFTRAKWTWDRSWHSLRDNILRTNGE